MLLPLLLWHVLVLVLLTEHGALDRRTRLHLDGEHAHAEARVHTPAPVPVLAARAHVHLPALAKQCEGADLHSLAKLADGLLRVGLVRGAEKQHAPSQAYITVHEHELLLCGIVGQRADDDASNQRNMIVCVVAYPLNSAVAAQAAVVPVLDELSHALPHSPLWCVVLGQREGYCCFGARVGARALKTLGFHDDVFAHGL